MAKCRGVMSFMVVKGVSDWQGRGLQDDASKSSFFSHAWYCNKESYELNVLRSALASVSRRVIV